MLFRSVAKTLETELREKHAVLEKRVAEQAKDKAPAKIAKPKRSEYARV